MSDFYSPYETGLNRLLERLDKDHPHYTEALTLQARLLENIRRARLYGDPETDRAARAEVVHSLNRLTLDTLDVSFNELSDLGLTYADMQGAPLDLRPYLFHRQFELITELTTRDFVGREFLFDKVNRYLNGGDPEFVGGYVVIEGEPGIGKTAFIARLVKLNRWVHHYVGESIVSAKQFLEGVCAQLTLHYNLGIGRPLYDPTDPTGLLLDLLSKTAAERANWPVVILLDALDEASDADLPPTVNRLHLPRYLPEGAFIVATTQPQSAEIQRLNVAQRKNIPLEKDNPQNLADVRLYIETFIRKHSRIMSARIAAWGVDHERFIKTILDKSEGNFMFVVSLMRDILDEQVTRDEIDRIQYLPQGLESYYAYHWQRMKALAGEDFDHSYKRVAGFVAVAKAPVSVENLMYWTRLPRGEVVEVLHRWKQFFYETEQGGHPAYRLYHTSFRSFLNQQMRLESFEEEIMEDFLRDMGL